MEGMTDLMDAWRKQFEANNRDKPRPFNLDGVVSEEHWEMAPRKVLFVLKETNSRRQQDIREAILRSSQKKTGWHKGKVLRRVGRWAYGLTHYDGEIPDFTQAKKSQFQAPLSIAYLNLRKTSGGARTNAKALERDVRVYAEYTRQQIELINPEIVVLCGTYNVVKKELYPELKKVSARVHSLNERIFINVFHPAQRTLKARDLYDQVLVNYHCYAQLLEDSQLGPAKVG
ncbi:hypothetical protein [Marinobacterium sedimentorum]|uniref:hypothetical protein n=1 Tax=Marinobacterium sedimentorum TaxID=2927804 RepID=UPI0020C6A440|nr:hypothetical protein [Marinobacterium sedimentorum]MCP8687156.1 hypothetical protein [Marinobacterium sedimentorum]